MGNTNKQIKRKTVKLDIPDRNTSFSPSISTNSRDDQCFYYSSSTEDSSMIYQDKVGQYRVWKIYMDLSVNNTKDLHNKLNQMDKLEEKLNQILDLEQNYFIVSHQNGKYKAVKIEIAVKVSTKKCIIEFIDEHKYDLKSIFFDVFGNDPSIDIYTDFNKYSPSNNTATTSSNMSLTDFVLSSSESTDNNRINENTSILATNNYNKQRMNGDWCNKEKKNKMFVEDRVRQRNVLFDDGRIRISYLNALSTPTPSPNATNLVFTIENLSKINVQSIKLKVHKNHLYKDGEYTLSETISNKIGGMVKKIQIKHLNDYNERSGKQKRKILKYQIMINCKIKNKISRRFIGKKKTMKPMISPSITPNIDNANCYDDKKEILKALRKMNKKLEDTNNSLSEMIGIANNINNIQCRLIS